MTISFTSTYRVPFKQPRTGITPGQKDALKAFALKYDGIVPTYREGNVKFSVRKKFDAQIEAGLKRLGFSHYKKVDIHNVHKNELVDALEYKNRFKTLDPENLEAVKASRDFDGFVQTESNTKAGAKVKTGNKVKTDDNNNIDDISDAEFDSWIKQFAYLDKK